VRRAVPCSVDADWQSFTSGTHARAWFVGFNGKPVIMLWLISTASRALARFGNWFDNRFGWFFTNGMKDRSHHEQAFKA